MTDVQAALICWRESTDSGEVTPHGNGVNQYDNLVEAMVHDDLSDAMIVNCGDMAKEQFLKVLLNFALAVEQDKNVAWKTRQ